MALETFSKRNLVVVLVLASELFNSDCEEESMEEKGFCLFMHGIEKEDELFHTGIIINIS